MKKLFTLFAIMLMAITASAKDLNFSNGAGSWTKNGRTYTQTIDGVTFTVSYNSWTEDRSLSSLAFAWVWNDDYDEDEALPGEVTLTVSSENASFTGVDISATLITEEGEDEIEYTSNEVGSWKFTLPGWDTELKFETLVAHIQDTPTGITEVNATSSQKTGKFLKDGKLVIVKDGKQYNATGQEM